MAVLAERMGAAGLQIVQLRTEMRGEFSAVRSELARAKDDLLVVIKSGSDATQLMFDELSKRVGSVEEQVGSIEGGLGEIRTTMATSDEMHRLHNVVLERLDQLGTR